MSQLLSDDDRTVVADSSEKLQKLISEFGEACQKRKLRVNVSGEQRQVGWSVGLDGENLEEWESF